MARKILKIIIVFLFFLFPFHLLGAIEPLSVTINEIAWMGTGVSYSDEWIELKNNKGSEINLEGWILKADDGTPEIDLVGTVPANSFYLLERTDDETVPEISADLIYKGALGNKGEVLKLYDSSGSLVDEVNCKDGWLAGNNKTKQTMERINSEWQTSQNPGGTPKAENSEPAEVRPPQIEAPKPAEVGPPPTYPDGIVFNEILPSPEGPDAEEEWIELFNQNDFDVELSEWKIKDITGSTKTYTLNAKIPANGYLVLLRPETKITLNNSGDGLNLIFPNGETADSITFGKASLGQSFNKIQEDWFWSTILTPGAENIIPLPEQKTQTRKEKPLEQKAQEDDSFAEKESAALSKIVKRSNYSVPFIALGIAIFSAVVILILKKLNRSRDNQFH